MSVRQADRSEPWSTNFDLWLVNADGSGARNLTQANKAWDAGPVFSADGTLAPGQVWHQESVIGSVFAARYEADPEGQGRVRPFIHGRAHVVLDAQVVFDPADPFAWGL